MQARQLPTITVDSPRNVYIKYSNKAEGVRKNYQKLQAGILPTYVIREEGSEEDIWFTHVFLATKKAPRTPLFSTYIYSSEEWFDPGLCKEDKDCPLMTYSLHLECDFHLTEWYSQMGYMDNFLLRARCLQHQDLTSGQVHECFGAKKPIPIPYQVWFEQDIYLADMRNYSLSASMHRSLYGRNYKLYRKGDDGHFYRLDCDQARAEPLVTLEEECKKEDSDLEDYPELACVSEEY